MGCDDALAQPRVLADLADLVGRQWTLLHEHVRRDRDHADVVQPETAGELRIVEEFGLDLLGELTGETHDAVGVRGGLAEGATAVVVELEGAGEAP